MQIKTEDIRNGGHIGEEVWICHYLRPDLNKKPLRNVPPTRVLIRPSSDLPENKRVYYSKAYFSPIGKNGQPTAKVISPVDNTGHRMYVGNELFVFTTEEECVALWNEQVQECCERIDYEIENAAKTWRLEKEKLINIKV